MKKTLLFVFVGMFSLTCLFGCSAESRSIGIIGGADGPTAIFVAGNSSGIYLLLFGILVVAIAVFLWFKRKK